MNFEQFNIKIQERFASMQQHKLFRCNLTGDKIWETYLKGFKPGEDPVFRDPNSTEHTCNNDMNFVRRYGNIVAVTDDYKIINMFDIDAEGTRYENTVAELQKLFSTAIIKDIFVESYEDLNVLPYASIKKTDSKFQLGHAKSVKRYTQDEAAKYGNVNTTDIYTFHHFHVFVDKAYVNMTRDSVEKTMAPFKDSKNVFKRGLDEISIDTLRLVKDLINQGSLLDGQTHLHKVESYIKFKEEYDSLSEEVKDTWCWLKSNGLSIAKFRNELIGTLCVDLSEGMELNQACQTWNKRVDPANYMKAKAPITQTQINNAKQFVVENGYEASFDRRFATLDDIKVSEILHSNVGTSKIKEVSIFDNVKSTSTRHKKSEFDGVEEVHIDKFMTDILPTCSSVEVFFTNKHKRNLVSLTTTVNADSKPIFKWTNNYSWTFNGNLAGVSQIKEAVKTAGGNVEGVLRASMIWNESGTDTSDLDIWCKQPNNRTIGFNSGFRKDRGNTFTSFGGQLDLDNTHPGSKIGVENIYFKDLSLMKDGVYKFWVHQFSARNSKGFKFEIEFNGEIYQYEYNKVVSGNVDIAEVTLKDGEFSIRHILPSTTEGASSETIYGIETNNFHKVNLLCLSPNHWNNNQVGNKFFMFMLEGCKAESSLRGFHVENLIPELLEHRKVMEVLASTQMIEPADKQLSGLGFNATVRDEVVLRLSGTHKRVIRLKF